MKYSYIIVLTIAAIFGGRKNLIAQSDFYAIDSIQEIRLYFTQSNWDEILDSLYIAGDNDKLGGDLEVNGTRYYDVGVRYKGFSSFSTSRQKNPFNIELDYVLKYQNHQGITKIKLSNVIQDPSFVREVLSYEVARKYMPASKANYANVYVNDTLIGLYTNVESVDDKFLDYFYGDSDNTFFKCNPENLVLNGENSNLGNSPGTDIANYYPFYKLKSDEYSGWNDLYEFIDVLNDSPENIETLLNVDRTLWMHAFNYTLINFDSYVGYAQNYYLYQDDHGRFNPILWDLNMSFASYRLTDASDNWDGFTVAEAKTIDPLQHINSVSVKPRPLIRNLLSNDTFKRMYLAHIRTILEENFSNQDYANRAQYFQSIIDASVANDTNKFYSYVDFINNLDTTVSDLVDYPGIIDLMDDRTSYLASYPGMQVAPDILNVNVYTLNSTAGDDVWITAKVTETPTNVMLAYRFAESELFTVIPMLDDGTQNDGTYGDSVYGASIQDVANIVQYYIYAENDSSGRFSPERAAYEFYTIESKIAFQDLVINEVMANNAFSTSDQSGEYDDWIEVYNNTPYKTTVSDMYLSNDSGDLKKWALPEFVLESDEYFTVWADGDTTQNGMHTNFMFENTGDSLWFSYGDGTIIDSVFFGEQYTIASVGRYPNGSGSLTEMKPTFARKNVLSEDAALMDDIFVFPNPANNEFYIKFNHPASYSITITTLHGRQVFSENIITEEGMITVNTSEFAQGIYLLHFTYDGMNSIKKVMVIH